MMGGEVSVFHRGVPFWCVVLVAGALSACSGDTTSDKDTTDASDTDTDTDTDADSDTDADTDTDTDADTDTEPGHTGLSHTGVGFHTGDTGAAARRPAPLRPSDRLFAPR
jgi:hypothetical protein